MLRACTAALALCVAPGTVGAQRVVEDHGILTGESVSPFFSTDAAFRSRETARYFRIGHLRGDPESPLDPSVFDRLRDFLTNLPAVRKAMHEENVQGIEVQSADSENILVDWMNQRQIDLVFAPAMAFTRRTGPYEAVFQLSRPKLDIISPGGERVVHRGAVFVNNRSPLFHAPGEGRLPEEYLREVLPRYLAGRPVAFVNSYSAAGYYYPYLRLADLTSNTQFQINFCTSSEEVVKSVINGIYEIGACDKGVIDQVLASGPPGLLDQKDKLVRVILETEPIATDPVAFLSRWRPIGGPTGRPSPLGREIRNGISAFFNRNRNLPRLIPSSNDRYEDLEQSLERFNQLDTRSDSAASQTSPR